MHDPLLDAVRRRLRSFAQRSWLQLDSVLPYRLTARCPELAADRTHARRGAGDSRYAGGASRRARAIERDDAPGADPQSRQDRKSTRLNSSHGYISYAVFCLKKKKTPTGTTCARTPR